MISPYFLTVFITTIMKGNSMRSTQSNRRILFSPILVGLFASAVLLSACATQETQPSKKPQNPTVLPAPIKVPEAHNTQNSLDWAGYYTGTTPCADCSGIDVWLHLQPSINGNAHYILNYHYQDKGDYQTHGSAIWRSNGFVLDLKGDDENSSLFIGENFAEFISTDENQGDGRSKNTLRKVDSFTDTENVLLIDPRKMHKKVIPGKNIVEMPVLINTLSTQKNLFQSLTGTLALDCTAKTAQMSQMKHYSQLFASGRSVKTDNRKINNEQLIKTNNIFDQALKRYCTQK